MKVNALTRPLTDGVVSLRRPEADNVELLVAGSDDEVRRFLGEGSPTSAPTAVVLARGRVVGWVDHDLDRDWLAEGDVNIGYATFSTQRGRGFARRALTLLTGWLAEDDDLTTATLLIDPANAPSIALARRCGFARGDDVDGQWFFTLTLR